MQNAIRGMVEALDDHSTFLTPDEFDDMKVSTSGTYAGIGVEVVPGKGGVSVVGRMAGSPAERAGIRTGDVIVRIDDVAVDPADLDAAIARMRGPGRQSRSGWRYGATGAATLLEFQVERAHVQLHSVAAELLTPDYGYLRITSFTDTTAAELERPVAKLEHSRARKLDGFVIDLRNDPGGVLDAAAQIADDFLDHGTIVSAEGRAADARFRIEAKPGDITNGAQLVVLVNGGSASASEILAAALHDNHRATLIGRRTYGKGSVQTIMPLHGWSGAEDHDLALLHPRRRLDQRRRHHPRHAARGSGAAAGRHGQSRLSALRRPAVPRRWPHAIRRCHWHCRP